MEKNRYCKLVNRQYHNDFFTILKNKGVEKNEKKYTKQFS